MARLVAKRRNFGDRAPIVEALIDLRADTDVDAEGLEALARRPGSQFPEVAPQMALSAQIRFDGPAPSPPWPPVTTGYLLHSAERDRAVQYQRRGMTMSHLHPYRDWASLVGDARGEWGAYVEAARARRVRRLGVRYINRFELPGDDDLSRWFDIRVQMATSLPLTTPEVSARFVHRHPHHAAIGLVQYAVAPLPAGTREVVLDIDVYFDPVDLDPADPAIWARLEDLCDFKNDVFFGSITEKTEEWLSR